MLVFTLQFGKIIDEFINKLSATATSSPRIDNPSILTQLPIRDFHPIMLPSIKLEFSIVQSDIITEFVILEPLLTTTLGPITTLGPMRLSSLILALGCFYKKYLYN